MKITKCLAGFALIAALLGLAFRACLSHAIANELWWLCWIAAAGYAVLMFGAGWFWGRRDRLSMPIFDIGARFHATTYLVYIAISYGWFWTDGNAPSESIEPLNMTAIIWGACVAIHLIIWLLLRRQHSIDGLNKRELFE